MPTDSPATDLSAIGLRERLSNLHHLEGSTGFRLLVEAWEKRVAADIDAKVWDTKTTDEERRILVETRARLMNSFRPEKIVANCIVALRTEIERQQK